MPRVSAHICNIGNEKLPRWDKEAANSPNFSHNYNSQPEKTTLRLLIKKANDNKNKNWKCTLQPRQKVTRNDLFKKSITCTLPRHDQVITLRIIVRHTKLTPIISFTRKKLRTIQSGANGTPHYFGVQKIH